MRMFFGTALLASLLGVGEAQQTVGGGDNASTTMSVTAAVDTACSITKPADYIFAPTLNWTQSSETSIPEVTTFVVKCALNDTYTLTWQPAPGYEVTGLPGPFGGTLIAGRPVRLFLNGTPNPSSTTNAFRMNLTLRRVGTNNSNYTFQNPQVAGTTAPNANLSAASAAATTAGQTYRFFGTMNPGAGGPLGGLGQEDASGVYSGIVQINLTVN